MSLLDNVQVRPAFFCDGGNEVTTEDAEKRTYTKAHISESDLFWAFGVEGGFIDCSVKSLQDLERIVDEEFKTVDEIKEFLETH